MLCVVFDAPGYRGPRSDHFDGRRFKNLDRTPHGSFGDLVRWLSNRERGPWRYVDAVPGPPPPTRVDQGALRVTLVNHATVLLQVDGINVLTDPIWSKRCSPVQAVGPKRFRPPGLRFEDLPPIDLVLLSHDHYDHLDVPTLKRLALAHSPRIVTGLGNAALLARHGISGAVELDWWQRTTGAGEAQVISVPARHFSGRGPTDRDRSLWMGFALDAPSGLIYFAGDTGWGGHFQQVRHRLGAPRLSLLPIGAYRPEWFMSAVHISPAEALRAHRVLESETSVAIHYGTFALADDDQDEPADTLRRALGDDDDDFRVLEHGAGVDLGR